MNTSSAIDDRLYQVVGQVLGIDPSLLTDDSSPETIASWDSLNHLNLVMAIESEYGISLSPDQALQMHNVGLIRALLGEEHTDSSAAVEIVDCREEHVPALREFVAHTYGADYVLGANPEYFRWQFGGLAPCRPGEYQMKLALVDGTIRGCLGCFPVGLSFGDQTLPARWLANWMVDQDQRHVGLGPLLVREVSRQCEVTLALGPNRAARDILARMGWTDFTYLSRQVCVLDRAAAARLTESGELAFPDAALQAAGAAKATACVSLTSRFDETAAQLWDRLCRERRLCVGTRRTAEFLNWRYADHPTFDYRLLEFRDGPGLRGFAVYRVEQAQSLPVSVGRIVELVAEPDIADALVSSVLHDARSQGVAAADFFCAHRGHEPLLGRHGFLPGEHLAAQQIPILYQPIDRRRAGVSFMADLTRAPELELCDWYVTKSDGDQDRPT